MHASPRHTIVLCALMLAACGGDKEPERTPTSVQAPATTPASPPVKPVAPAAPSSGCLGDEGGCRAKVLPFELCDGESIGDTVTLDALFADADAHAGKTIALRGPLIKSGAECTEGTCEKTCCNTCTSVITIGDDENRRYVRLASAETPGLYLCRGDESLVCCQFQARGQEVIALGTFQTTVGINPPVYQLFASELCQPE